MSRRERAAPAGPKGASRAGDAPAAHTPRGSSPDSARQRSASWEEAYRNATAAQQEELLALAERQGVVYTHQLPISGNGAAPVPEPRLLGRFFGGDIGELDIFHPDSIEFRDPALDEAQREAVARALHTPDICLVQGLPGTGKSRVVIELVLQAAARGQRVLLLAPTASALDHVLPAIAACDLAFPLRCLSAHESLEMLPAEVRALTLAERLHSLQTQTLARARGERAACEQRHADLRRANPPWEACWRLADAAAHLSQQHETLRSRVELLQSEVEQATVEENRNDSDDFSVKLAALVHSRDEEASRLAQRLAETATRLETSRKQLQEILVGLEPLRPLVEAKQKRRWWTGVWWRASLQGRVLARWQELEAQRQEVADRLNQETEENAALQRQQEISAGKFQQDKKLLIANEVERRAAELRSQLAALERELHQVEQDWRALSQTLSPEVPRPTALTQAAVQQAQELWHQKVGIAEDQRLFAQQWVAFLEQNHQALAARIPDYANVVAATVSALADDALFGERPQGGEPVLFDLLVLEEAEQVSEAELLQLGRRARRWVLVGEPGWHDASLPEEDRRQRSPGGSREVATLTTCFQPFERLWRHLHPNPQTLPYAWSYEEGRLCCLMRQVRAEDRTHLHCEPVADFPDIELRILTLPGGKPILAEILFPSSMPIEQAKAYVYRELEELPIRSIGHCLRWVEEPDRLVLRLSDKQYPHEIAVTLESGVRELLGTSLIAMNGGDRVPWQSYCLEFDRSAGWHRQRAEDWVHRHLGLRDLGRTVRLEAIHRMEPELAGFLSDCIFGASPNGTERAPALPLEGDGYFVPVEFVPVPSLKTSEAPQRSDEHRRALRQPPGEQLPAWPRKGGAGYELDLADPRNRDRLPLEMRSGLPNRGFVNYQEGQAVVRRLAAVAAEATKGTQRQRVVVLALYAAQAELIRRLLRQSLSPSLAAMDVAIHAPQDFQQGEADVVLLSMTRSHSHRPVAFGDGPRVLARALTRARSKLLLFGDPGTLMRRSLWEGPLEHLNESAAAQERNLIARLVCHLEPTATNSQASRLCPANST